MEEDCWAGNSLKIPKNVNDVSLSSQYKLSFDGDKQGNISAMSPSNFVQAAFTKS